MPEYDAFGKFRQLDEQLGQYYDRFIGEDSETQPQSVEDLRSQLNFQTQRANRAEKKIEELQEKLLEKDLESLKTKGGATASELTEKELTVLLLRAHRLLAKIYHPDKNPANNPIMRDINRAFTFLKDPEHNHL